MSPRDAVSRRSVVQLAGIGLGGVVASGETMASSGSVSVPGDYSSIQAAVNVVSPGGVVEVGPGTYNEQVQIGKPVTIVGDPGASGPGPGPNAPVLDGEGAIRSAAFHLYDGTSPDDVTIRGFEMRNYGQANTGDTFGIGVRSGGGNDAITVTDCYLHDITATGISVAGWGQNQYADWTIERNVIEGCGGSAVRFDHVSDSKIRKNVIRGGPVKIEGGETDRRDTEPDMGIQLHANTREGLSSTQNTVTIANNTLEGEFENAAVYLLAINKNHPEEHGDTLAKLSNIDIVGNDISGLGPSNGIALGVNPVYGGRTRIRDVTIRGNSVSGGSLGIHCGTGESQGLAGVDVVDNSVTDCQIAVTAATGETDGYRDITVRGCDLTGNTLGLVTWGDVRDDSVLVRQSNIHGMESAAAANMSSGRVDARRNYWGAPNGPTRDAGPIARAPAAQSIEAVRQGLEDAPQIGGGGAILEASAEIWVTPWLSKPA